MYNFLWVACGTIMILCASATVTAALIILRKVLKLKSFRFLKLQLMLMISYEVTVFVQGILWCANFSYYEDHVWSWFWSCVGVFLEIVAVVSLLTMFWNLAFMYWLSSK